MYICVLLLLQLCREFRAIGETDGRATSLKSSWPDRVEWLAQLGKAEEAEELSEELSELFPLPCNHPLECWGEYTYKYTG